MYSNISNGGLILKLNTDLVVTDIANYSGTYLIDRELTKTKISQGLFWFMNNDERFIYYSDQRNNHHLHRFNLADRREDLLVSRACYGLILYRDWLFFIDENDQHLYRCTKDGRNLSKLVDEKIAVFTLLDDTVFYSTVTGQLKTYDLNNMKQNTVLSAAALGLIALPEKVIFIDKNQGNSMAIYDIHSQTLDMFQDIQATSFNSDGQFVYCANRKDDWSIYRISVKDKGFIRICGEQTDFVHVIDNEIYFCNLNQEKTWHRMSLNGGQATKVSG